MTETRLIRIRFSCEGVVQATSAEHARTRIQELLHDAIDDRTPLLMDAAPVKIIRAKEEV